MRKGEKGGREGGGGTYLYSSLRKVGHGQPIPQDNTRTVGLREHHKESGRHRTKGVKKGEKGGRTGGRVIPVF